MSQVLSTVKFHFLTNCELGVNFFAYGFLHSAPQPPSFDLLSEPAPYLRWHGGENRPLTLLGVNLTGSLQVQLEPLLPPLRLKTHFHSKRGLRLAISTGTLVPTVVLWTRTAPESCSKEVRPDGPLLQPKV